MASRPRSRPTPPPKNPSITKVLEPSAGQYVVTVRMPTALLKDYPNKPWGTTLATIGISPKELEKFVGYELVEIQPVAGSEDLYWIFQKLSGPIWTDTSIGSGSVIPQKFRRQVTTVKTEQEVTSSTLPTALSGNLIFSSIKSQPNSGKAMRIEVSETIADPLSPLISPSTEDQLYVVVETIVDEGADPDEGFGIVSSRVEAIGDNKAVKTTKIAVTSYDEADQTYVVGFSAKVGNVFDPRYGLPISIEKTMVDITVPIAGANPSLSGSVVTAIARTPESTRHASQETRAYTLPSDQVWYGARRAPAFPKVLDRIEVIDSITNPTLVPVFKNEIEGLLQARWTRKFTFGQPTTGLFTGRIYRPEEYVFLTEYDRSSLTTTTSSGTSTSIGDNSSVSTNSSTSNSRSETSNTSEGTSESTQISFSTTNSTNTGSNSSTSSGTSATTNTGSSSSVSSGTSTTSNTGYSTSSNISSTTSESSGSSTSTNSGSSTSSSTSDTTGESTGSSTSSGDNLLESIGNNWSSSFTATSDDGAVIQGDPGISRYSSTGTEGESRKISTGTSSGTSSTTGTSTSNSSGTTTSTNGGTGTSSNTGTSTSDTTSDTASDNTSISSSNSTSDTTSSGSGASLGTSIVDSTSSNSGTSNSNSTSSGTSSGTSEGVSTSDTVSSSANTGTSNTNGSSEFASSSESTSVGKSVLSLRLPPCLHGSVSFNVLGLAETISATTPTDIERNSWVVEDVATNHWQDGIWVTETVEVFIPAE